MSYFSTIINDINGVMMYYFEFLSTTSGAFDQIMCLKGAWGGMV
jgi:hypothetical protein